MIHEIFCEKCGKKLRTLHPFSFAEVRRVKVAILEKHAKSEMCEAIRNINGDDAV